MVRGCPGTDSEDLAPILDTPHTVFDDLRMDRPTETAMFAVPKQQTSVLWQQQNSVLSQLWTSVMSLKQTSVVFQQQTLVLSQQLIAVLPHKKTSFLPQDK